MSYSEVLRLRETATAFAKGMSSGVLNWIGLGLGFVASVVAISYFVPGFRETILQLLNSCVR